MKTSDLLLSLVIIIIFVLLYLFNILGVSIQKGKDLWPINRCNPAYMANASSYGYDPVVNFNNCVQNIQATSMSELLLPINYNIKTLNAAGNEINNSVIDTKKFVNRFRNDISNIVKTIMSVFLNLTINIEQSNINIKDVLSKLIATLTTMTYYSKGSQTTIKSAQNKYNNDVSQLQDTFDKIKVQVQKNETKTKNNESKARLISQAQTMTKEEIISQAQTLPATCAVPPPLCFHPDTFIKTSDSQIVKIKDLKLTDRLKNGQRIYAIMNLNNLDNSNNYIEDLYLLQSGEEREPIFVSGSHLIFDKSITDYIHVKNHPESVKTSNNSDYLVCLITSDHTIPLGNYIFHDWEDNNGSPSKNGISNQST